MNKLILFSILGLAIFTTGSVFAEPQSSGDEQDQMMGMMDDNNMMGMMDDNNMMGMMDDNNMMGMMDDNNMMGMMDDNNMMGMMDDNNMMGMMDDNNMMGMMMGNNMMNGTSPHMMMGNNNMMDMMMGMMNMMMNNPQMMMNMMGMMMGNNNMMGSGSMMNQVPQDVIIQIVSPQKIQTGKQAEIILQVFDRISGESLNDATVTVGIEKGAAMTSMNMVAPMIDAKNIGDGKYLVTFTPDDEIYYTMHTHVIPPGKSMHSMMQNHMNIGLISEK